jgi:MOSC domain-containing protein YiiM
MDSSILSSMPARVVALHLNPERSRSPLRALDRAELLEEKGVEGDRHAKKNSRRQVLVVEKEVLDDLKLAPGDLREQITVEGLDLNGLVFGARLRVGAAVLEAAGPCDPCERMEELRPGLEKALQGRRGRFVRVVVAGAIAVGDVVHVESPQKA